LGCWEVGVVDESVLVLVLVKVHLVVILSEEVFAKPENGCAQWMDTGWDWPSLSVVRVALCIGRSVYSQVELLRGWNR